MKTKTYIKPASSGATKNGESNDCTVRAMTNSSGIDYEIVHALLKKNGRKDNKGVRYDVIMPSMKELGFEFVGVFGKTIAAKCGLAHAAKYYDVVEGSQNKPITLGNLVKSLPFGKFVVIIKGHAVALIDGKLIDTFNNSSQSQVAMLFQYGEM